MDILATPDMKVVIISVSAIVIGVSYLHGLRIRIRHLSAPEVGLFNGSPPTVLIVGSDRMDQQWIHGSFYIEYFSISQFL